MINVKEQTAKMLQEDYQISPETTEKLFQQGILADHVCRNALIKREYSQKAQPKEKQRTRAKIAERFCVSVKLIEKVTLD